MTIQENSASVNVEGHGMFYGSLDDVRTLEAWTKRKLAAQIVAFREDSYSLAYWMKFPKIVLVLMVADSRVLEVSAAPLVNRDYRGYEPDPRD